MNTPSEIVPGLWQGGVPWPGAEAANAGFDMIVFAAREWQPMPFMYPDVQIVKVPLDDDYDRAMPRLQALAAMRVAAMVAKAVRSGQKVLVTCFAGRNRSGLIVALAVMELCGVDGVQAARVVRERRQTPMGPALANPQFRAMLGER